MLIKGTFNRQTYFDKIDAIANQDRDALNNILKQEGITPVSENKFMELSEDYQDYLWAPL
ncbi:hypothetical protein [Streptococcus suis]